MMKRRNPLRAAAGPVTVLRNGHTVQFSRCFRALRCFLCSGVHQKHREARINRASTVALHRPMG